MSYEPLNKLQGSGDAVAAHVFALIDGPLPLADGLRAVAEEAASRKLKHSLRQVAAALDAGQSLDDALGQAPQLPTDIRGLLLAATRTGNTGLVLVEWLANRRAARAHWGQVRQAFAYPLLASAAALAVVLLIAWVIVPQYRQMVLQMEIKLGLYTRAVMWVADYGGALLVGLLISTMVLALGIRFIAGASAWSRTIAALPVVGDLWQWTSAIELLRGLQLLLQHQIPLPEALQLAEQSTADAHLAGNCNLVSQGIARGESFTTAVRRLNALPRSTLPLLQAGERQGALAENVGLAAQLLEARLRTLSLMVSSLGPPLIFLAVALSIGGMFVAMYAPLVSLIQGLS